MKKSLEIVRDGWLVVDRLGVPLDANGIQPSVDNDVRQVVPHVWRSADQITVPFRHEMGDKIRRGRVTLLVTWEEE